MKKRILSLCLLLGMAFSLMSVPAYAALQCHTSHDSGCGYTAGSPCGHNCGSPGGSDCWENNCTDPKHEDDGCPESCYVNKCTHSSHDPYCGYEQGTACTHVCNNCDITYYAPPHIHEWSGWFYNGGGSGSHSRQCELDYSHIENGDCVYENGVCSLCRAAKPAGSVEGVSVPSGSGLTHGIAQPADEDGKLRATDKKDITAQEAKPYVAEKPAQEAKPYVAEKPAQDTEPEDEAEFGGNSKSVKKTGFAEWWQRIKIGLGFRF